MATSFATGTFNITTAAAGNTVVVSGLGFQPVFVLFWWSGRTESADAGGSSTYNRGFGCATSDTSFWAVGNRYPDGGGTSDTDTGQRTDACIIELAADAFAGWADLQSMDSDGFTIEIIDAFVTDLRVSYAAYGGSDIAGAATAAITATGAAPITQTLLSGLSFTPTGVIVVTAGNGNAPPSAVDGNAIISIGAALSTSDEHVLMACADDAAASGDGGQYCLAGELLACVQHSANPGTAAPTHRAELSSFGASNVVINWLERASGIRVFGLAWGGGNFVIGDLLTQTDTTTDIVESGFGFQPNGVVFFSGCNAAATQDGAPGVHDEWSIGAASSTSNRNAQNASSRDGNTNMFAQAGIEFDEVYINFDPTTDAIEGLMDVKSFDSDGFTCIMDDADPAQAFVWYLACGNTAVATKAPPFFPRAMRSYGSRF